MIGSTELKWKRIGFTLFYAKLVLDISLGNVDFSVGWVLGGGGGGAAVSASAMIYRCVDEDKVYVPTEKWTKSDGTACECTDDVELSCLMPLMGAMVTPPHSCQLLR